MAWKMIPAAMVMCALAAAASAVEVEYRIASWENTMDHFGVLPEFDSIGFDTTCGATNGQYALKLDIISGWRQGLRSANVDGLTQDFEPFFPQLGGATKLRLDVTSSKSLMNIAGDIQLFVYVWGQNCSDSPPFSFTTPYVTLNSPTMEATTTETVEFDLTKSAYGFGAVPLPEIWAPEGWFEMRIGYTVSPTEASPGVMFWDNLRAVKEVEGLLGDFNGNGQVEIADYTRWADYYGMPKEGVLAPGSYVTPGNIDIDDYTTWVDHFGTGSSTPEPASAALLSFGTLELLRRRRGRK